MDGGDDKRIDMKNTVVLASAAVSLALAAFGRMLPADILEAKFTLFEKEPWCLGFMWWKWDEQNNRPEFHDDPAGDKGFTVRGKPAQEVMRRLYMQKQGKK